MEEGAFRDAKVLIRPLKTRLTCFLYINNKIPGTQSMPACSIQVIPIKKMFGLQNFFY